MEWLRLALEWMFTGCRVDNGRGKLSNGGRKLELLGLNGLRAKIFRNWGTRAAKYAHTENVLSVN